MTASNFHAKSSAIEVVKGLNTKLDGKVILITGATSGIGVETARALASANAHIIITARDMKKGAEVIEDIKKTTGNNKVEVMEMDLTSLQSVRNFVSQFQARKLPINILICNAGIMACPYSKTVDGFESQFAVNHLAHFLLTTTLLPQLKAGKPSRVVVVSSLANKNGGINWNDINWEKDYERWNAYAQSKTANILFAKQLNKLYASEGIKAYSLHPGAIFTNLQKDVPIEEQRAMGWLKEDGTAHGLFKTIEQGASTSVYAALAPELDNHGGEYLEDCAISQGVNSKEKYQGMAPHSIDMEAAERLWKLSEQMIVYASSGLYTLIDVTTLMAIQSSDVRNETIFSSILSSPETIVLNWISLSVYFIVVLLIIILLCGIQLNKPWLLFIWSVLMIIMLLIDGIVTVLSLREHQQQIHRPSKQLYGIFISIFHFRYLNQAISEYNTRQRMLLRYNTECPSASYDGSCTYSDGLLNPPKANNNDYHIPDIPPPSVLLPRAQIATIQRRPISTMFHSRNYLHPSSSEHTNQQPINDYNEDFRYNVPLQERYHQQKKIDTQEL
ncbi:unnamed protein product [Adineta steineri]|uniref:Uncharacterized protein n=1 Tax=Adineta steineri TaxID=433720 RepID=A0A819Q3K3_9BILA|nr:unnamed protein product [Adineta steineri]